MKTCLTAMALPLALAGASTGWAKPISDAQFERFMAVMPDPDRMNAQNAPTEPDPEKLAAHLEANPGKEEELKGPLLRERLCMHEPTRRFVALVMRSTLNVMGPEKTEKLIGFYGGDGIVKLEALMPRLEKGDLAAQTEAKTLLKGSFAEEFAMTSADAAAQLAMEPNYAEAREACARTLEADLSAAGLKAAGPPWIQLDPLMPTPPE